MMFSLFSSRCLLFIGLSIILVGCSSHQSKPMVKSAPSPVLRKQPPKIIPAPIPAPVPKPLTGLALVNSLLPLSLADRGGWGADIHAAFEALKIIPGKEQVCAVLAEIGQESSFQSEPVVFGLRKIVRRELEMRREKYNIPQWLMVNSLALKSPDGRSYDERIEALRTENDVNRLYEDMISEIPFGGKLLADSNPVQTGGPMQVSLSFAKTYTAVHPYPFGGANSLRKELFTRKGGLYFGIAYLLDYPASYGSMIFRFADFNAGRYSSRNAAFQSALYWLSGVAVETDGDLLRYKDGVALEENSQSMQALLSIAAQLNMDRNAMMRDLLLEKSFAFEQSPLYNRVFTLAATMPRARIPEITLQSPKISRKLTTAMYAKQVDARYQSCLKK